MLIAEQNRKENIAEYILYMWQVEDMVRAYDFDISKIETAIIKPFNQPIAIHNQIVQWYRNLMEAMQAEGISQRGHLYYLNGIVQDLSSLNISLLKDPALPDYKASFDMAVPAIHDIVLKSNGAIKNEVDACFNALYGFLMLKLQKKDANIETIEAIKAITLFMNNLCSFYHKFESEDQA